MVEIGIIIDQIGIPPGVPGSREDLVVGSEVTLSYAYGITSYKWEIIGKPYTSVATLSSTSLSEVSFTPDVVGSYLIQLTINNKIKQRVVAAILTDRYGIRIPAAGEGEEIPGGSFKAITESIRTLEEDSLNAAKIQGNNVSLNTPELNDFLRFNGTEWVPSNKLRTDNIGFSNSQNIFIKIPLSTAIPANSYWEYNAGTSSIKPHWKTVSGASPTLDISWNAFPHGSILKKVYIIASCNNITSNQLTVKIEKNGAVLNHSNQIISFIDQFVSTTEHTVSSPVVATLEIPENTEFNTEFTHGNSNDNTIVSEDLSIRLIADGSHEFKIFDIYVYFQTLSIGLYNGPLVAEGGGGGEEGGGGTLDNAYDFGGDGAGRSITADTGAVEITTPVTSDNPCLTLNQNITDSVHPTILLNGETNQIFGEPVLDLMASEDITFNANSSEIIPFNSLTDPDLVGFTSTSIIGALNELKDGGGATSLQGAYDGGNEIIIPIGGNSVIITNEESGEPALLLDGTGLQRIKATGELEFVDGYYEGIIGPTTAIPLTDSGARDFTFSCESLVDGINKAWLGAGAAVWIGQTTNDTLTEIFINGIASERYIMASGSTTVFKLTAIARDNVGNRSKALEITAVAHVSIGGTASWVNAVPVYTVIDQSDVSGGTDDWDIALSINIPDSTMRISVTGQTSTTIQWAVFNR